MVNQKSHFQLFKTGTDFEQIHFLDNFHEHVDGASDQEVSDLLKLACGSDNAYIKRSAFKLLCDLTLAHRIGNPFQALDQLYNLIKCDNPVLQVISIKYLPYFQQARDDAVVEQLKELSDNPDGDVASQAYFCLGLFQLTDAISYLTVPEVIISLEKAKPNFQAASQSTENRVDAEFYLTVIHWLKSVLSHDSNMMKESLEKLKKNLLIRNLYESGNEGLELDFLTFLLADQLHTSFTTSSSVDRWLEVKQEAEALFQASEGLRMIRDSATSSQFLAERLFSNVFEIIEESIYRVHLTSNKSRLEVLRDQEAKAPLGQYLQNLIERLPSNGQGVEENLGLLALLSDIEGTEKGLAIYNGIPNKNVSTEILTQFETIAKKYKNQPLPYKTGTERGEEVYKDLKVKIEQYLPSYPQDKLEAYFGVVEETIRYARDTLVKNDRKLFPFLYSKSKNFPQGKGQDTKEEDLQDSMLHFFKFSKIMDGLDHEQARFVDGGRVDILYKKDLITIPIELKKSLNRPTINDIESNYIAQAQTYSAGYDQLGIFVLLELSDKASEPPPNFKDWFKIHHLRPSTNSEIEYPDYVISVVIPGNKTSPSAKSKYK